MQRAGLGIEYIIWHLIEFQLAMLKYFEPGGEKKNELHAVQMMMQYHLSYLLTSDLICCFAFNNSIYVSNHAIIDAHV